MANVRRSARLSRTGGGRRASTGAQNSPAKKKRLGALVERDETPEVATSSIAGVLATPTGASKTVDHLKQLSGLKTPQTEPQLAKGEMHPKTIHQTTSKAPDSGLKLGFADVTDTNNLLRTPSKISFKSEHQSDPRQSMASTVPSSFQFKFATHTSLSADARKLMESVKADAEQIKAQLIAEKAKQKADSVTTGNGQGNTRKIAPAKGKTSRFSDVHMAEFKKMDSIANHASAFRARPGLAAAPAQSLKRSSSRAKLDDPERSQIKEKCNTRPDQTGKTGHVRTGPGPITAGQHEDAASAKRTRHQNDQDVSTHRKATELDLSTTTLYSPTKSSLARAGTTELSGRTKVPVSQHSPSAKLSRPLATIRAVSRPSTAHTPSPNTKGSIRSPSKLPLSQNLYSKPLPALPTTFGTDLYTCQSIGKSETSQKFGFATKLPILSNLKSILRSKRKDRTAVDRSAYSSPSRTVQQDGGSPKKVDFTPSVKSRYAVKLAVDSPLPAKARRDTPRKAVGPLGVSYDSSAYVIADDGLVDGDSESYEVSYPELPPVPESPGPVVHTFAAKANELNRRESKDFKSIFTDLHTNKTPAVTSLTSINTTINKTDPAHHVAGMVGGVSDQSKKMSSPTIRHVRTSNLSDLVQPFEHQIATVPHGLPGKKRRHQAIAEDAHDEQTGPTQDRSRDSVMLAVPGAWTDTILEDQENTPAREDNEEERSGKRMRMSSVHGDSKAVVKKPNPAREKAAKNAKERKGKGILSLSRLNILSRPRQRN